MVSEGGRWLEGVLTGVQVPAPPSSVTEQGPALHFQGVNRGFQGGENMQGAAGVLGEGWARLATVCGGEVGAGLKSQCGAFRQLLTIWSALSEWGHRPAARTPPLESGHAPPLTAHRLDP